MEEFSGSHWLDYERLSTRGGWAGGGGGLGWGLRGPQAGHCASSLPWAALAHWLGVAGPCLAGSLG